MPTNSVVFAGSWHTQFLTDFGAVQDESTLDAILSTGVTPLVVCLGGYEGMRSGEDRLVGG